MGDRCGAFGRLWYVAPREGVSVRGWFLVAWVAVLVGVLAPGSSRAYDVLDEELKNRVFDRAKLKIGGFLQPRFRYSPSDPAANVVGETGFSVQRARLEIQGQLLSPSHRKFGLRMGQKFSLELMPNPQLQDAYLDIAFGDLIQIRVGQFKAPIHRAILVSDANNLFPDRNQITTFVPEREIGLMLHGWWGKRQIEWQAAIFNGEGPNRVINVNRRFLVAGRVVFSPFGSPGATYEILRDWRPEGVEKFRPIFSLGYSFHYNVEGDPGQELAYVGHNVEGFFHWRFLTVMSEFFFKFADFQDPAPADFNQIGWYVQLGAFWYGVPWAEDHIALVARVEQGDRFKPINSDQPAAGPTDPGQASRRTAVGIGLYAGEPLFKFVQEARLIISYTFKEELEGFPLKNDEFNLSMNFTF